MSGHVGRKGIPMCPRRADLMISDLHQNLQSSVVTISAEE